jgi:aminoglycoside/choline kinase family phosphotransferase
VTPEGDFFKISTRQALFADEPGVTQALAEAFPNLIPRPVAVWRERGWMLLGNFGQTAGNAKPGEEACRELVLSYARLQRSRAGEVEQLTRMGCLDWQLERLGEQFTALLADDAPWASLKPQEPQALRACEAELLGLLERLDAYGIPPSLLHGNLHLGNVAVGESYRVFDWIDACIAHSFLDLATLLEDLSHTYDPQTAERLCTAYLEAWQD